MPVLCKSDTNQLIYPCVSLRMEQWGNSQSWGLTAAPCCKQHRPSRGWAGFKAHLLPTLAHPCQCAGSPPGPVCPLGRYFADFGMLICKDEGKQGVTVPLRAVPDNLTIHFHPWEANVTISVSLFNLVAFGDNCSVIEGWVSETGAMTPQAFPLLQALESDTYAAECRKY